MKKLNKKQIKGIVAIGAVTIYTLGVAIVANHKVKDMEYTYNKNIETLNTRIEDNEIYRELYKENTEIIKNLTKEKDEALNKVKYFEEQIILTKKQDEKYSKTNFANKKLNEYPIMTIDEMNKWISDRAPENSAFRNKGKQFLKASAETGLDPRYLVAHSALETGWGTSKIVKDKNNYYGIGAFNHDPYNSAYSYSSSEEGILEGARWIAVNYTDKGYDTLNNMLFKGKAYCTLNDGKTPDISWLQKIVSIIH